MRERAAARRGPLPVLSPVPAPRSVRRRQPTSVGVPARRPPHPGKFLDSRFLKPLGISQTELAEALGVSRRRVNELINGRRAITPDTAVRLAMYFGNEAAFWMHLQVAWDMHSAVREVRASARRP